MSVASGCLVVAESRFIQPASCPESFFTFVPVMSESSPVPNIFPAPIPGTNSLQPTYDRDVPTHQNEKLDHGRLRDARLKLRLRFQCSPNFDLYPTFSMWFFSVVSGLMEMNFKCKTVLADVATQLSPDGRRIKITRVVVVPLAVILLAKEMTHRSCGFVRS